MSIYSGEPDDYSSHDHAVHLIEKCGKRIRESIVEDLEGWPVNLTETQLRMVADKVVASLIEEINTIWETKP